MMNNAQLDAEIVELDTRRRRGQLNFTLYRDIELEPRKLWLVHDYLGAGELSCIFGPPGSGKSVLAGDLAAHVAAGRFWFGRRVQQSGVLYVAIERAALVKRRLAAFRTRHTVDEIPLAVASGHVDLRTSSESVEEIVEHAKRLAEIGEVPTSLILIDTVSRALAGGDENSPKDMGSLVGNLGLIQEATGAHVAVLHHNPSRRLTETQRPRSAAWGMRHDLESLAGCRTATVDKANDGPDDQKVTFDLKSVELHFDEETNTHTTAPVVICAEAPVNIPRGPTLTPNQTTMLNLIGDAMPQGIQQKDLFDRAREIGIGKNRPATAYDVCSALKGKGLVYEFNGQWLLSS